MPSPEADLPLISADIFLEGKEIGNGSTQYSGIIDPGEIKKFPAKIDLDFFPAFVSLISSFFSVQNGYIRLVFDLGTYKASLDAPWSLNSGSAKISGPAIESFHIWK